MHHDHGTTTGAWAVFEILCVLLIAAAAVAYGLGVWRNRNCGRGWWPWYRTVSWYLGLACAGAALVGPLATAARTGFTEHMAGHLLLGMIGPLLLVLAAPITLALRTLPGSAARGLSRLLRCLPVRVVSHPVTAALLNVGGLWLLYTTPLYHLMHSAVWLHALVHAHVFLAGVVFTAALVGPDPNPHRAPLRLRAVVMVIFIAAHSILGKWLYAHPPLGVDTADARAGAQLMYYGGDVVDVVLLALLFLGWYPLTRPGDDNRPRTPRALLRANPAGTRSHTPHRQETSP